MKRIIIPTLLLILAGAFFWSVPTQSQGAGTAASIYKTLFANLGTPVDSSVRYCSDCQATTPCSSGGTGAFANRVNGVWNCASGGGGAPGISCSGCTVDTLTKYNGSALVNARITDNGTTTEADSGAGSFLAGDVDFDFNGNVFTLNDSSNVIDILADGNGPGQNLNLNGASQSATLSANGAGGFVKLELLGATNTAVITSSTLSPNATGTVDLGASGLGYKQIFVDATVTTGGTTGAQTINKSAGSVNFAALATSLVVTSDKVTANSIVMCTVATNDTTLKSVQCVPGAGSFTMFGNAAATAETRVNFWILNQ